jgi:hypothetical protein
LSDRSTLPGRGSQSGIGCELAPVIKVEEQSLRIEDRGKLRPDALSLRSIAAGVLSAWAAMSAARSSSSLSVFARRRRRDVAIDAGSTT